MVQGVPYVHWKIKDAVDLTEIDPVYLWGTVVETNKGPIDTPVFITDADQAKKIFNYNLEPFFANGGQYAVVVRAYGGQPRKGNFKFSLDESFSYVYIDYDYYDIEETSVKATVKIKNGTLNNERPAVARGTESGEPAEVAFSEGRWRLCNDQGVIYHYYKDTEVSGEAPNQTTTIVLKEAVPITVLGTTTYHKIGTTQANMVLKANADQTHPATEVDTFTKAFNESDVTKIIVAKTAEVPAGAEVIDVEAIYPGDFSVPISIQKDIRAGYRISIKDSDDYTIMISGATTLDYINKRINERASNVSSVLTNEGKTVQKAFASTLVPVTNSNGEYILPVITATNALDEYTAYARENGLPVGSIFAKVPASATDSEDYSFKLVETVTYLAEGSNGAWDSHIHRIIESERVTAHKNALDHLANIKLAGIFCNYGEDDIQKVYADHVSTTEPQGMNSAEVCKWRTLIVGANALDRTNDKGEEPGFKLMDKAVAFDNENILFIGQGLIDDGYKPEFNIQLLKDEETGAPILNDSGKKQYVPLLYGDEGAVENQLLPFQCTQYIAGLRSKLFYGDSIFGGEAKKEIFGVGNLSIAPLFTGENKVLWQPENYVELNQHGVLTFTEDYNHLSLMDGVTTRQSPLEEDEEGVQSIVKYAKHTVHEVLQQFIGRNITGDLQTSMEVAVRAVLGNMQTLDQTLVDVTSEGYSAYDVEVVLVPKSNAKQILAKAYVYLKLTPAHALRQIEVELTVQ